MTRADDKAFALMLRVLRELGLVARTNRKGHTTFEKRKPRKGWEART